MRFEKCNAWEERYKIFQGDEWIGYFVFQDFNSIHVIHLYPEYRGKGLLSKVYSTIEKQWNVKLKPSACILNPIMVKYWKKRKANLSNTTIILK